MALIDKKNYAYLKQACNGLREEIKQGLTINELSKKYDCLDSEIISTLIRYDTNPPQYILEAINFHYKHNNPYKINDNKILVISDTHLGGFEEDKKLIAETLSFAKDKKEIKNIIHAGDIVQGISVCENQTKEKDSKKQLLLTKQLFELINTFANAYYIYGNHDYRFEYHDNGNIEKELKPLNKTIIIGKGNGYITLEDNDPIRIFHDSVKEYEYTHIIDTNLTLEGHHHFYSVRENNTIYIPALAKIANNILESGFLIIETTGKEYIIKKYLFNKQYNIIEDSKKELVLKKKS